MVSGSARKAFAAAPYSAVKAAAEDVDPNDLVTSLADPDRAPGSRGPMFLLLGRAGAAPERKRLATWMVDPAMQRAAGFDALLAAWLVQTGEPGIREVEKLFRDPDLERAVVGGAWVRALGFHARNEDVLSKEAIVAALRRMLAERAAFGVTLEELARLDAWGERDAVLAAYERHKPDAPWTIGPVLRFLESSPGPEAKKQRERLMAELARPAPEPPAPGRK